MKKFIVIILFSILIFCFSGCVLEDACYFYRDTAEMDNFTLAMNKVARCCLWESTIVRNMQIIMKSQFQIITKECRLYQLEDIRAEVCRRHFL